MERRSALLAEMVCAEGRENTGMGIVFVARFRGVLAMTREERRKAMPLTTAFVDDMREAFGADQVISIDAKENGLEVKWRKADFSELDQSLGSQG